MVWFCLLFNAWFVFAVNARANAVSLPDAAGALQQEDLHHRLSRVVSHCVTLHALHMPMGTTCLRHHGKRVMKG